MNAHEIWVWQSGLSIEDILSFLAFGGFLLSMYFLD